jgi:hypothetical protein
MPKKRAAAFGKAAASPPKWIKPQLSRLVDEAPTGADWLHEIKYDGYPAALEAILSFPRSSHKGERDRRGQESALILSQSCIELARYGALHPPIHGRELWSGCTSSCVGQGSNSIAILESCSSSPEPEQDRFRSAFSKRTRRNF